jgi:uncharacterized integral membrane protein (TIGR00698 family)
LKAKLRYLVELMPGILLLAAIGYSSKFLEYTIANYSKVNHLTIPNIEYVLWAIILGIVIANTVGVHSIFEKGIKTYEFWLKTGIVLLGARFLVSDVLRLGSISLILVFLEIVLSLFIMTKLGEWFGLKPKLTTLLAVGSSICGVSAIIAAKGAIDADEEDSSTAMLAILTLGAIALFTFPFIGHLLNLKNNAYGMWAGLAVDNTAEATAAGVLYSEAAGKIAVLAKMTRNATIGFVVLGYAWYWAKQGLAKGIGNKTAFLWEKFPKFVLGFLAISLLASCKVFDKGQLVSLANLSRWAFLLAFAGVGLRTNFHELIKQGIRPFIVGALGEIVIAVLTLGLVLGADTIFGL